MTFSFLNQRDYMLAEQFYRMSLLYIKKDGFKKYRKLKSKIEQASLSIISNVAKSSKAGSHEKRDDLIDESIQLAAELYALYNISLGLNLIQKKDIFSIKEELDLLITELQNSKQI